MSVKLNPRKSYIYLVSKVGAASLNLLSIALFTRLLTADLYGNYLLFSSYVTLVCSLLFWWHRLSAYRYYHKFEDEYGSYIRTSYYLYGSLIILIIILCFIVFFLPISLTIKSIIYMSGVGAIVKSNFDLNQNILNIRRIDNVFGINVITRPLIFVIVGLILIFFFSINYFGLIYAFILSFLVVAIYSNYIILNNSPKGIFRLDIASKFASYGFPMIGLFIFDYILTFSDRLFLDHYMGSGMVGVYGANYDLIKQILLFLMIIQSYILYPQINSAYEKGDQTTVYKILSVNLSIFITVFMPLCILVIYFNQFITAIFIGEKFTESSAQLIPIFSVMFLLWGTKIYHFDYFFQLKEKTKYPMYILCLGSIINICFNIYLIPKLGMVGAAYATSVAYLVVFIISIIVSGRLMPTKIDAVVLIKTCIILIICITVINIPLIVSLNTIAKITIFLSIYSTLTIKFNFQKIKPYLKKYYR